MEPRTHGRDGRSYDKGRLPIRKVVEIAENDEFSVSRWHPAQCSPNLRRQLRTFEPTRGIVDTVDFGADERKCLDRQTSTLAPQAISTQVPNKAVQVRCERRPFSVIATCVGEQRDKDLLSDVLCGVRRAGHCPSEAIDDLLITVIYLGECFEVAGCRTSQQLAVRLLRVAWFQRHLWVIGGKRRFVSENSPPRRA